MDLFDLPELEICPWALREGVILDRLDQLSALRLRRLTLGGPPVRAVDRLGLPRDHRRTPSTTPTELGYDAVEVMVGIDVVSQSIEKVRALRDYHQVPVCAMHAPCLLITQRVWGTDPWVKLERSAEMAKALDADVVVVHPPFRWQRDYASGLRRGHRRPRAPYRHRLRRREHVSRGAPPRAAR